VNFSGVLTYKNPNLILSGKLVVINPINYHSPYLFFLSVTLVFFSKLNIRTMSPIFYQFGLILDQTKKKSKNDDP